MARMHNPPHPGMVLREYLGETTITKAALQLGVGRVTLQRIVNGVAGISPDMAYRLGAAFGTSPELWAGMQCSTISTKHPDSNGRKSCDLPEWPEVNPAADRRGGPGRG